MSLSKEVLRSLKAYRKMSGVGSTKGQVIEA